jgi:hypothetical protein
MIIDLDSISYNICHLVQQILEESAQIKVVFALLSLPSCEASHTNKVTNGQPKGRKRHRETQKRL